ADVVLAEAFEDVEEVAHRSCQSVEAGDDDDVSPLHFFQHSLQGGPGIVRTPLFFSVDPLASRFFPGGELPRLLLSRPADSSVSDLHFWLSLLHRFTPQHKRPSFRCQANRAISYIFAQETKPPAPRVSR